MLFVKASDCTTPRAFAKLASPTEVMNRYRNTSRIQGRGGRSASPRNLQSIATYLITAHSHKATNTEENTQTHTHTHGPALVQAHRTRGVTGFEGQEGANGVGGGIGVGGGNGDVNGDVDGHGDVDGAGTGTGVEVNEGAQDGNGDGSGDRAGTGTGTGTGTETRTVAEMGTGTTIPGTIIGLWRAEARQKSARNRKIAVDVVRETGETRMESEKNVEKKGLVQ